MKNLLAIRDIGVYEFKSKKDRNYVMEHASQMGFECAKAERIKKSRPKKSMKKRVETLQKFLDETLKEEMLKDVERC